jgi:hypothetical protein
VAAARDLGRQLATGRYGADEDVADRNGLERAPLAGERGTNGEE